ncbi:MAG: hypothetical protein LBT70_03460 [Holosporaceae bacterium]|jgi:hypothetical protein|nr:hypothetical protein [Holosporaceae bacterium]
MKKMTFGVRCVLFTVLAIMCSTNLEGATTDALDRFRESGAKKKSRTSEIVKQKFLTQESFGVINENIVEGVFRENLNSKNIYDNLYELANKCWDLIEERPVNFEEIARGLFQKEYVDQLLEDTPPNKYFKLSQLSQNIRAFADDLLTPTKNKSTLEADGEKQNQKESSTIMQKLRNGKTEDKMETSDMEIIQQDPSQLTSETDNGGESTAISETSSHSEIESANEEESTRGNSVSASDANEDNSEISVEEIYKWRKSARASELKEISRGEKIFETLEKNIELYSKLHVSTEDEKKITAVAKNIKDAKETYNTAVDLDGKNLNNLQYNAKNACGALTTAFECAKELASVGVYKIAELTQDEENTFFRSALREKLEQFMNETQVIPDDMTKLLTLLPPKKLSTIKTLAERIDYIGTETLTDNQQAIFSTAKNTIAQVVDLNCKTVDFPVAVEKIRSAIKDYNKVALTPVRVLSTTSAKVIDEAFVSVARGLAHYMRENLMYMLTNVRDGARNARTQLEAECEKIRISTEAEAKKINAKYEQDIIAANPKAKSSSAKANLGKALLNKKEEALAENKKPLLKKEREIAALENYENETDEVIKQINENGKLITESTSINDALQVILAHIDSCEDLEGEIKSATEILGEETLVSNLDQKIKLIYTSSDVKKEFQQISDSCEIAKKNAK